MPSLAQIRANRINAMRSTGPRTGEGKERTRYNALKHGLTAKALILPWEDAAGFHEIRGSLFSHYNPQTPIEMFLVDQVSQHWWRINRSRQFETKMFAKFDNPDPAMHPPQDEIESFRRYDTSTDRAFYRALTELEKAIRRRPKPDTREVAAPADSPQRSEQPPINPIGSVSQNAADTSDLGSHNSGTPKVLGGASDTAATRTSGNTRADNLAGSHPSPDTPLTPIGFVSQTDKTAPAEPIGPPIHALPSKD